MGRIRLTSATALLAGLVLAGCGNTTDRPPVAPPPAAPSPPSPAEADGVAAERAKLSPADRTLVEDQGWCVVSSDERLGAMGPPLKLDIGGQPVFVCCKGCRRKAESDPAKTLAKVESLKPKVRAERDAKN